MKKKQLKTYCPPKSILIHIDIPSIMETSFPGQHEPAQPGGSISNAFSWEFSENEEYNKFYED